MKKMMLAAVCAALLTAPVAFAQDSTSTGAMNSKGTTKGSKMDHGKMHQGMTKKTTTVTKKTVRKTS